MKHTYTSQVVQKLLSEGYEIHKRECDGHWELCIDGEMMLQSRSLGDLIRSVDK